MDQYIIVGEIGRGASGSVHWAFAEENSNQVFAVKKIILLDKNEGVPSSVIREISLLKELDHTNIVKLINVVTVERTVFLVLEYMDMDLKKFMGAFPELARKPELIKRLLHQLLSGLSYCHSQKVLHRDIKPENLLIDPYKYVLKIADFGSARAFDIPAKTYTAGQKVVGQLYKAPELLLNGRNYSTPVDIWSVGCIFAEMVLQKPLFTAKTEFHQLSQIFRILGTPTEETWPGASSLYDSIHIFARKEPENLAELVPGLEPSGLDLLSKMLRLDPRGRVTADEALVHPYFADAQVTADEALVHP